ncbi:MAG: hypothetical protein KAH93_05825 [Candidatus Aenigmarchaeota archaeon]|nr:hypothetical protein [Candidatus Aenigmarchaeota archaeon]
MSHGYRRALEMANQLTSYEPDMQLTSDNSEELTTEEKMMTSLGIAPEGNRLKKVDTPIGDKYVPKGIAPMSDLRQYV